MKIKYINKKVLFKLIFSVIFLYAKNSSAQTENPTDTAQQSSYQFNDYSVDNIQYFDLINWNVNSILQKDSLELGKVYEITQQFTNTQNGQIIIKDIVLACGCTSVDWYKLPISSGGTGWIKIKYSASIPDKKYTTIKLIGYDAMGVKPLFIQPVKIAVNVKYNATN